MGKSSTMTQLIPVPRNSSALAGPVKSGPLVFQPRGELAKKSYGRSPLVAIDPRLEDYQILVAGVEPGTKVLVLDPNRDALPQIARALSTAPADSLQIVCHGAPGTLNIGKTPLTGDNISQYSYILSELGVRDILLYACNVAEDKNFIQNLHKFTGANIAASANRVGNAAKGGTWELEEEVGEVTTASAFSPEARQAYPGVFVSFSAQAEKFLPSRPFSVSIADFNTDDRPDLAVTLDNDDQVAILLGSEEGVFADPVTYDTDDGPAFSAIADLDGDGDLDLAISNSVSNNVSVLLGEGDGTFGEAENIAVGTAPYGIVAADFNGDDILDLAVGNDGGDVEGDTDTVSLLIGNGDGTFAEATNFDVGDGPSDIVTEDFDGDGNPDIATANDFSNDVSVLLGDGVGGFADATSFSVGAGDNRPYDIAAGDFNGDDNPDLAVSNYGSSTVAVLLGDGEGGFGDPFEFDVADSPYEILVGDLDGDGNQDIATTNPESDNISVLLGDGAGSFADATDLDAGNAPWTIDAADFDNDDLPDVVVGSQEDGLVALWLNTSDEPTEGDDDLVGTPDADRINALEGNDTIRGGAGNDTLSGDDGDDRVVGNRGNDWLYGKDGDDLILGRLGNDRLFGGDGDDQLEGGVGRDRINGGAGNDTLVGGASIDRFIFNINGTFDSDAIGIDTIEDFDLERDFIVLNRSTFAALESDAGEGFSVETEFAVVDSEDAIETSEAFIVYNSDDGGLYYNPNGADAGLGDNGAQFAILTGTPDLQAEDILLNG